MRRRTLNLLTALSLVLCVTAAALWARSYATGYGINLPLWRRSCLMLQTLPGRFAVHSYTASDDNAEHVFADAWQEAGGRDGDAVLLWGTFHRMPGALWWRFGTSYRSIIAPLWLPALAFAVAPAAAGYRSCRRRARVAGGLGPRCGYDLRATPDRCPECGYAMEAT